MQLCLFHGRRRSGPLAPLLRRSSTALPGLPAAAFPPSPPQDRCQSKRAAWQTQSLSPFLASRPRLPLADGGQHQRLRGCWAVRWRQSKGGWRGLGWRDTLSCCCRRGGTPSRWPTYDTHPLTCLASFVTCLSPSETRVPATANARKVYMWQTWKQIHHFCYQVYSIFLFSAALFSASFSSSAHWVFSDHFFT